MGQLIDSSVIMDFERRGHRIDVLKAAVRDDPAAIATITASELLLGVHRADTSERGQLRRLFVEDVFEWALLVPFDLRVARTHGRLWAELATSGQLIGAHDLIIAATALAHGHSLLTHNLREFERVPGLTVRQPTW